MGQIVGKSPAHWSEAEERYLVELWMAGYSFSAAADAMSKRFGYAYTYNMIAGKRYRLRLPDRPTTVLAPRLRQPGGAERPTKPPRIRRPRPDFRTHPDRDKLLERMLDMAERGLSSGQIARQLGLTRHTVYWQCNIHGVRTRRRRMPIGPNGVTPGERAQMVELRLKGLSIDEIGRRLDRSHSTVKFHLILAATLEEQTLDETG